MEMEIKKACIIYKYINQSFLNESNNKWIDENISRRCNKIENISRDKIALYKY